MYIYQYDIYSESSLRLLWGSHYQKLLVLIVVRKVFISYKLCGKVVENRRRDIEAAALLGILFITVNNKFISSKICETIK